MKTKTTRMKTKATRKTPAAPAAKQAPAQAAAPSAGSRDMLFNVGGVEYKLADYFPMRTRADSWVKIVTPSGLLLALVDNNPNAQRMSVLSWIMVTDDMRRALG